MEILHTTIKGTGKPLLILHGYFGMSDNWKTLGNQFSENYEVHDLLLKSKLKSWLFLTST